MFKRRKPERLVCKRCNRRIGWFSLKEAAREVGQKYMLGPKYQPRNMKQREETFLKWAEESGLDDCAECEEIAKAQLQKQLDQYCNRWELPPLVVDEILADMERKLLHGESDHRD